MCRSEKLDNVVGSKGKTVQVSERSRHDGLEVGRCRSKREDCGVHCRMIQPKAECDKDAGQGVPHHIAACRQSARLL